MDTIGDVIKSTVGWYKVRPLFGVIHEAYTAQHGERPIIASLVQFEDEIERYFEATTYAGVQTSEGELEIQIHGTLHPRDMSCFVATLAEAVAYMSKPKYTEALQVLHEERKTAQEWDDGLARLYTREVVKTWLKLVEGGNE